MATPAGKFRPARLILTFVLITAGLYALMFFTPGSNAPKLGIDLQGGTRITLTAQTPDGSTPTRESMSQARTILEGRVNGSGVAGAQVQVEGSNQLVVTVPGGEGDLGELTRTASLNLRPTITTGIDYAAALATVGTIETASPEATASVEGSGTETAPSSPPAPISRPAIGDDSATVGNQPDGVQSSAAEAPSAEATTEESGQGLRAGAAATTAATTPAASTTRASTPATTPASDDEQADPSGSAESSAVTPTVPSPTGTDASATGTDAAAAPVWPLPGSDPQNPNQPAGTTEAEWTEWLTAAQTAVTSGQIDCSQVAQMAGLDDADRPLIACGRNPFDGTQDPCGDSTVVCSYLLQKTLVPGTQISRAAAGLDVQGGGGWGISVEFTSEGFSTWSNFTLNNVGTQTAFTLDGQVLSNPVINQHITTVQTRVSGSFNQANATELANALNYGALPLAFAQGEATTVSAQLGLEYLQAGLIAGGIGLLLVVIYCLVYYRLLGLITILSLVLSFGLVYVIMVLLGRWIGLSLDMAGIAGLIVAIGITADSFVIYFERLKDEVREGRSFRSAVPRGWERAKSTILSADAVSFLSALVLYVLAVGEVRGFAFTLGLTTVLDLVVVFLVTHPLVAWASGSKVFQSARFSGLGAVAKAGAEHRAATAQLVGKEA